MRLKAIYRNDIISVYNDSDNCLLHFITFSGKHKVLCYDDNMYYPSDDYYTYCDLLNDMVACNDIGEEDYSKYEKRFANWLKRELMQSDMFESKEELEAEIKEWREHYAEWHAKPHVTAYDLLSDLYQRLVDDYNGNKKFEQHEEDRNTLRWLLDRGF